MDRCEHLWNRVLSWLSLGRYPSFNATYGKLRSFWLALSLEVVNPQPKPFQEVLRVLLSPCRL